MPANIEGRFNPCYPSFFLRELMTANQLREGEYPLSGVINRPFSCLMISLTCPTLLYTTLFYFWCNYEHTTPFSFFLVDHFREFFCTFCFARKPSLQLVPDNVRYIVSRGLPRNRRAPCAIPSRWLCSLVTRVFHVGILCVVFFARLAHPFFCGTFQLKSLKNKGSFYWLVLEAYADTL